MNRCPKCDRPYDAGSLVCWWCNAALPAIKSRQEKLEATKQWFLRNMVEDPIDGTEFDCAVLDAFKFLEQQFATNVDNNREHIE